jgi:hypothetical protein
VEAVLAPNYRLTEAVSHGMDGLSLSGDAPGGELLAAAGGLGGHGGRGAPGAGTGSSSSSSSSCGGRGGGGGGGGGAAGGGPNAAGRTPRALTRAHVPADNNCLFTSCALLCDPKCRKLGASAADLETLRAAARGLRRSCAQLVAETPDRATTLALLGVSDAEEYRAWIQDETHWGGEPEVSMIAERYDVEIVVATCDGSQILHYGGGRSRDVVYVLYTGQHYDPLLGPHQARRFPPAERDPKAAAAREAAALDIAEDQNRAAALAAVERSLPAGSLPNSPAIAMGRPVKGWS